MRNLIIIALFAMLAPHLAAQRTISTLSLQLSFPKGEYQESYDATGVGLRWNILHRPRETPLSIGGEIGFLVNGSDSRSFDMYYMGFYDRYTISATNNIVSLAFKMRADLVSHERPMMIFVDGTIGTNLFFSSVDVSRETYFGQSEYTGGNSTKGHWAFVWGPGLGVEIPLNKNGEVALSIKGTYLFGSRTKYLTDPYVNDNGDVYFTERESETTMLLGEVGIRFGMFNKRR